MAIALILISGIVAFASVVDAAEPKKIRDIEYKTIEQGGVVEVLDLDLGGNVGRLSGTYSVDGITINDHFMPYYLDNENVYRLTVPEKVDKAT